MGGAITTKSVYDQTIDTYNSVVTQYNAAATLTGATKLDYADYQDGSNAFTDPAPEPVATATPAVNVGLSGPGKQVFAPTTTATAKPTNYTDVVIPQPIKDIWGNVTNQAAIDAATQKKTDLQRDTKLDPGTISQLVSQQEKYGTTSLAGDLSDYLVKKEQTVIYGSSNTLDMTYGELWAETDNMTDTEKTNANIIWHNQVVSDQAKDKSGGGFLGTNSSNPITPTLQHVVDATYTAATNPLDTASHVFDVASNVTTQVFQPLEEQINTTINFTGDLITNTVDFAKTGDLGAFFDNTWDDFLDLGHELVDTYSDHVTDLINFADTLGGFVGTKGFGDYALEMNEGFRYVGHAALNGNGQAIVMIVVLVVSIVLTVVSFGATSGTTVSAIGAIGALANSTALGLTVASIAKLVWVVVYAMISISSLVYGIYGITQSLAAFRDLGAQLLDANRLGIDPISIIMNLWNSLKDMQERQALSNVVMAIDGTKSLWMPGGELFDAPRAGDVLFNPAGYQNTVKFLGRMDRNITHNISVNVLGYYEEPHKMSFGSFAGDEQFSVISLSNR